VTHAAKIPTRQRKSHEKSNDPPLESDSARGSKKFIAMKPLKSTLSSTSAPPHTPSPATHQVTMPRMISKITSSMAKFSEPRMKHGSS
jgi:hypothetical protein